MNKQDTIERLCRLVTRVGEMAYSSQLEHDCFCRHNEDCRIHPEILSYIENAVDEKLRALKAKD